MTQQQKKAKWGNEIINEGRRKRSDIYLNSKRHHMSACCICSVIYTQSIGFMLHSYSEDEEIRWKRIKEYYVYNQNCKFKQKERRNKTTIRSRKPEKKTIFSKKKKKKKNTIIIINSL